MFWGTLKNYSSTIYIEFGYDYYMYLKCRDTLSKEFIANCKQEGIFIEEMQALRGRFCPLPRL